MRDWPKLGAVLMGAMFAAAGCGGSKTAPYKTYDLALPLDILPRLDILPPLDGGPHGDLAGVDLATATGPAQSVMFRAEAVSVGGIGDVELPCAATDFEYAFFHTATVFGNQLGSIEQVLITVDGNTTSLTGFCPNGSTKSSAQTTLNSAITGGTAGYVMTLTSTDPNFSDDPNAKLSLVTASGSSFASFAGVLNGGKFMSASPAAGDIQGAMGLPLFGVPFINVPLHALQVSFTRTGGALIGQINGAVTQSDVHAQIAPAVATAAAGNTTLSSVLDTGNNGSTDPSCAPGACTGSSPCQDANGTCEVAGDGKVGACEVWCNATFSQVIKPDIQVFHGSTYSPVNNGLTPDSLSIGIGFTAVQ